MDQLMTDAKLLMTRLREKERDVDILISKMKTLNRKVDAMKQYRDEILELNEVAHHRPQMTLVQEIVKENRIICELQQENDDLCILIDEYHSAIDMIMTKYRDQVAQLSTPESLDDRSTPTDQSQEVNQLINKICEMAAVMQHAVDLDEDTKSVDVKSHIENLLRENQTLRHMLCINNSGDSEMVEHKCCQTESSDLMNDSSFMSSLDNSVL